MASLPRLASVFVPFGDLNDSYCLILELHCGSKNNNRNNSAIKCATEEENNNKNSSFLFKLRDTCFHHCRRAALIAFALCVRRKTLELRRRGGEYKTKVRCTQCAVPLLLYIDERNSE